MLRLYYIQYSISFQYWTNIQYQYQYGLILILNIDNSTGSRRSYLSNWHTSITVSITLSPPSLSLTLKIPLLSRLSIRNIVSFYLIYCHPSLMPPSIASIYYAALVALILSISDVMPSCSYCIKKGLVYIIIAALSSHQPLSYTKYIKANMRSSCNVRSVSNAKYIYYPTLLNYLVPYLSYYKVLDLICC